MRISPLTIPGLFLFILTGCASMKPAEFEKGAVPGDPVQFFAGHTRSTGVVENRGGKPTAWITTETKGIWKDSVLNIEQDLYLEGGKRNHRAWKLQRIYEHHVEARANDIDGHRPWLIIWQYRELVLPAKTSKQEISPSCPHVAGILPGAGRAEYDHPQGDPKIFVRCGADLRRISKALIE